jgi:phage protein D
MPDKGPLDTRTVFGASEITSFYKDDERSIYEKYGNLIAPYFAIEVSDKDDRQLYSASSILEGNSWDLNGLIVNDVEIEESIDSSNLIRITINNPTVELASSNLFAEGNNIDVFVGYDGRRSYYMGRGIIVEISPKYTDSDIPKIELMCYDVTHFMMEEGKADIVPEGSEWWRRNTQTATAPEGNIETVNYNNAIPDTDLDEVQASRAQRINAAASEQGQGVSVETEALPTFLDSGVDPTERVIEAGTVEIRRESNVLGPERTQVRRSASTWQKQRFGRRRRKAGKVWVNKTDSEIVAAIFQSYGIVPYVEATNESVVRNRDRLRRNRIISDNERRQRIIDDPFGEEDFRQVEIDRRINQEIRPDEDYDQAQQRIGQEYDDAAIYEDYTQSEDRYGDLSQADEIEQDTRQVDIIGSRDSWRNINNNSGEAVRDSELNTQQYIENPTNVYDPAIGLQNYDDSMNPRAEGGFGYVTRGRNEGALTHQDYAFADNLRFRAVLTDTPELLPVPELNDRKVTQKAGTTDWDFIMKLAEAHGFIVFVFFDITSRRWIGYWGPESNVPQSRQFIFRYNEGDMTTIANANPRLSMIKQSNEIDLIYYDPVSRKTNRLRVALDNVNENYGNFRNYGPDSSEEILGDGPEITLVVHGQRVNVNASRRFRNADDARRWLIGYWIQHASDFITLEGDTIIGIPELRGREKHIFQGIERYSGEYFVTQARHTLSPGNGYKTSFIARKVVDYRHDNTDSDLTVLDQSDINSNSIDPESDTVVV